MYLYHMTFDLQHRGNFTPRVPENIEDYDEENDTIPRICFSSTLEGCLTSMPEGGLNLQDSLDFYGNVIKVFRYNATEEEVKSGIVIPPITLHNKGYVKDALLTQEYWLRKPVHIPPQDIAYIKLKHYDIHTIQHGIEYTPEQAKKLKNRYANDTFKVANIRFSYA